MIYKVTPKAGCKYCHGTGEVVDYVPYGDTNVSMPSTCECVDEQLPEEFDCMYDEVKLVAYDERD